MSLTHSRRNTQHTPCKTILPWSWLYLLSDPTRPNVMVQISVQSSGDMRGQTWRRLSVPDMIDGLATLRTDTGSRRMSLIIAAETLHSQACLGPLNPDQISTLLMGTLLALLKTNWRFSCASVCLHMFSRHSLSCRAKRWMGALFHAVCTFTQSLLTLWH